MHRVFNASSIERPVSYVEWDEDLTEDFLAVVVHRVVEKDPHKVTLYPFDQVVMQIIVPHSQPYSSVLASLKNGTGTVTWTRLFVYAVIVIATSSLLLTISGYLHKRKILLFECVVDVVNLLLNENAAIRYSNLRRAEIFILVPLTFTGLIVMNGILSIL